MKHAILLLLLLAAWLPAEVVDLTILHFNDFHAKLQPANGRGGAAHLVTAIERERANCPRCLLLVPGDTVQGSPVSTIYRGLPAFEVLRPARIDAFALGNHEFDYGADRINDFLAAAGYPVLAANFLTPEGRLFTEEGSIILERDGLRIGIVGVLMDDLVPKLTTPSKLGDNKLLPALDTLRAEAKRLAGQTDMLIALVHLWKEQCDEIVEKIPEYAVVVSGHDHGGMRQMFRVEDRVGVRLRSNGLELGRLDLKYDKAAKRLIKAEWKIIPITTKDFSPHAETQALVEKWERKVAAVVDVPVGESPVARNGDWIREWIERVMKDKTGAEIAIMNRGGVRDTFPQGQLLARNFWNVMPFDNVVVTAKVKGRLVPDFARPANFDPEREYLVTTIDYLVESMRGPDSKYRDFAMAMPLEGPLLRDVMIEWVKKRKILE